MAEFLNGGLTAIRRLDGFAGREGWRTQLTRRMLLFRKMLIIILRAPAFEGCITVMQEDRWDWKIFHVIR